MKLLSCRFLDPVLFGGKSIDKATAQDFPGLRVAGGFVWLNDSDGVPLSSVSQVESAAPMASLMEVIEQKTAEAHAAAWSDVLPKPAKQKKR